MSRQTLFEEHSDAVLKAIRDEVLLLASRAARAWQLATEAAPDEDLDEETSDDATQEFPEEVFDLSVDEDLATQDSIEDAEPA